MMSAVENTPEGKRILEMAKHLQRLKWLPLIITIIPAVAILVLLFILKYIGIEPGLQNILIIFLAWFGILIFVSLTLIIIVVIYLLPLRHHIAQDFWGNITPENNKEKLYNAFVVLSPKYQSVRKIRKLAQNS